MRQPTFTCLRGAAHAVPLLLLGAGLVFVRPCSAGASGFANTGNLGTARSGHTATLLPNGRVLVVAGFNNSSIFLASTELYDLASGTWTASGDLATGRYQHTATLLPNGKVLVAGGGGNFTASASAELYDPANGTWAAAGNLTTSRAFPTANLLPNGKVLVTGGGVTAELYDPVSGTWTVTGSLATGRDTATATLLANGKVLVVGGYGNGVTRASAELYDPASGTWTTTGSLATARYQHTATLLPSGKVLVTGGYNFTGGYQASAELYDPASGTWTATASLATAFYRQTATLMPNGTVLVAGGAGVSGSLASAELYDPASGTWTATGSLGAARAVYTATLLPNNKVLVAGGYNYGPNVTLASAELYDSGSGSPTPTSTPIATPTSTPTPTPGTTPPHGFGKLLNISTRLRVLGADKVLIGGFIVAGSDPKRVIIRAIGPSLTAFGVSDALADPTLELHDGSGSLIFTNDNWKDTQKQAILDTTIPPTHDLESAIVATLAPGGYTAIVRGKDNGTGVALVEVYDLNQATDSKLANISTRGFVDKDNNVMIGGFIVGPNGTAGGTLLVRAIGPSLSNFGIQNPLADPMLELHNGDGTTIASNDNWKNTQRANIQFTGIPPSSDLESAIVQTFAPGAYTAIVRGKNNGTGVSLIEVYDLTPKTLEQVSQLISASQGGVITLPAGSSVSIPPGVLTSDQLVTLSILSSLPRQPPNGFIVGVGPALSISFAPVPMNTSGVKQSPKPQSKNQTNAPSTNLEFVLNYSGSTASGYNGAVPIGEYILPQPNGSTVDNYFGATGQIDSINKTVTFDIDPAIFLNAFGAANISNFTFVFSQGNVNPTLASVELPRRRYWNGSSWVDTPVPSIMLNTGTPPNSDPKTLVFVHGVNSFVDQAFGDCGAGSFDATSQIMTAGGYTQAIGFDYNWTQKVDLSGQQLAAFIRASELKRFDFEGHSMGGAVVLSGASYITESTIQIDKIVTLGGAGEGTPVANVAPALATLLLAYPPTRAVALLAGQIPTLVNLITSPGIQDLNLNSAALLTIRDNYNTNAMRQNTAILTVAGTVPIPSSQIFRPLFGSEQYDGLIGVFEANLTGRAHYPVGDYGVSHIELECNDQIIGDVGKLVKPSPTPTPKLDFSAPEGGTSPPDQTFTIKNVGPAGSALNYTASADAPWLGLPGSPSSIIPLAAGASVARTVSVNSGGLSASKSPYTATITVSDPASSNRSQTIAVTLTINPPGGSLSLAITSQTWTPHYFNGQISSYSAVVKGTASGPVASGLRVVSFDFGSGGDLKIVADSWTAGSLGNPDRGSGDPATTTWTVTESFAGLDEVLTISLGNAFTNPSTIYVRAHP
jgi:pimeloyl-ACP methyl ester carboxylesterase